MQPPHPDPALPPGPGEAFFQVLLEIHTDVMVVLGEDGAIRYATPSAAAMFGREPVIGARLPDLVGDDARPEVARAVDRMLGQATPGSGPAPGAGAETWQISSRDGRTAYVEARSSDLRGVPAIGGLVLTLRDVTGQRGREEQLRQLAFHDRLTGLPNRDLVRERVAQAEASAQRNGTTAAVLFADLDRFKPVNDELGHPRNDSIQPRTDTDSE